MKRKILVELILYIIIVVIGAIILLSEKPKDNINHINPDFNVVEQRRGEDASLHMQ